MNKYTMENLNCHGLNTEFIGENKLPSTGSSTEKYSECPNVPYSEFKTRYREIHF
jgi:hypothetical protein